ncbi:unnamed protein product [Natator depressus]
MPGWSLIVFTGTWHRHEDPSMQDQGQSYKMLSRPGFKNIWWSARITSSETTSEETKGIPQTLVELKEELSLPADLCNTVDYLFKQLTFLKIILLATFWFKTLQAIVESRLLQDSELTLDDESRLMKSLLSALEGL